MQIHSWSSEGLVCIRIRTCGKSLSCRETPQVRNHRIPSGIRCHGEHDSLFEEPPHVKQPKPLQSVYEYTLCMVWQHFLNQLHLYNTASPLVESLTTSCSCIKKKHISLQQFGSFGSFGRPTSGSPAFSSLRRPALLPAFPRRRSPSFRPSPQPCGSRPPQGPRIRPSERPNGDADRFAMRGPPNASAGAFQNVWERGDMICTGVCIKIYVTIHAHTLQTNNPLRRKNIQNHLAFHCV